MPRYSFHLREDVDVLDEEGIELPSLEVGTDFFIGNSTTESDRIFIDHKLASTFEQVMSSAKQTQAGVVITLGRTEIVLDKVNLANLDASDFFF